MRRAPHAIVFAGPTLPAVDVQRYLPCEVWPPAEQGDVWRALAGGPRLLVLLDGVFESRPSVWHREILDALDAGVAVFGAASMGALRAVELASFGMVGLGQIFRWYRDGVLVDDGEVALLHAEAEHGYRPLTLPLVNVRHAAALAVRARVLRARDAALLVEVAEKMFYQDRHWARVLESLENRWSTSTRSRWDRFMAKGLEDLKAKDARGCLEAARLFLAHAPAPHPRVSRPTPSHVRQRKLGVRLPGLAAVSASATASRAGMRALALAGWARSLGMRPSAREIDREVEQWWQQRPTPAARRLEVLQKRGMDMLDLQRLAEVRVLERRVLAWAARLLPDGPSSAEGAALEIRDR